MTDLVYGLNRDDRIVLTDGDWDGTALRASASGALSRAVLYQSIWDFVSGHEVQSHLADILGSCRQKRRSYETLMRCDGPQTGVLTRMSVQPWQHGIVLVRHRSLRSRDLPDASVVTLSDRFCDSRCSHCCALRLGDDWVPSFSVPEPMSFPKSFVICPECRQNKPPQQHAFLLNGMRGSQPLRR